MRVSNYILFFLLFTSTSYSQIQFEIAYSTGRNDQARAITQTYDSGYAVVGSTVNYDGNTDVYLMKVDKAGTFLWAKRYGGYGVDWGQDIIETSDSGLAILGYGQQNGSYDMYFIRTNRMGDTLFTKFIGEVDWDFGYSLKQTSDNGFVLAGETFKSGVSKGYLVKIDANGTVLWKKTFGGNITNKFEDLIVTAGGNLVMVGQTESFGNGKQGYAVKTNSIGTLLWEKNYGNPGDDFIKSVVEISSGDYIIAGGTNTPPFADIDNWGAKINATGNIVQSHVVVDYTTSTPIDQNDDWNETVFNYKDSIVFAGKRSFENSEPGNIYVYRYSHNLNTGDLGGFQKFISAQEEIAYDGTRTLDDGMIFACSGDFLDSSPSSIYLIKMDSTLQYPHPFYNSVSSQNDITSLVEEANNKTVSIYPNPTQSKALISLDGFDNKSVTISIFSLYGELITSFTTSSSQEIDLSEYESGAYLIRINSGNFLTTKKLILAK